MYVNDDVFCDWINEDDTVSDPVIIVLPLTSNFQLLLGVFPIPTLPLLSILIFSVGNALPFAVPNVNAVLPLPVCSL